MSESEIRNAKISSTMLGVEDHSILTFFVHIDAGSVGQGLGGFALDRPAEPGNYKNRERTATGRGLTAIRKILETVGVGKWEDLPGTLIRVKFVGGPGSSRPPIIGHIMDDKWFDLKEHMEAAKFDEG